MSLFPVYSVVTYCTIGNRASEVAFVLTYLLEFPGGLCVQAPRFLGGVGKSDWRPPIQFSLRVLLDSRRSRPGLFTGA